MSFLSCTHRWPLYVILYMYQLCILLYLRNILYIVFLGKSKCFVNLFTLMILNSWVLKKKEVSINKWYLLPISLSFFVLHFVAVFIYELVTQYFSTCYGIYCSLSKINHNQMRTNVQERFFFTIRSTRLRFSYWYNMWLFTFFTEDTVINLIINACFRCSPYNP